VLRVLELDRLVHHVTQQQIGLVIDDRVQFGLRVAGDGLEVALLQIRLLEKQRPDLRHRIAGRDGDRLPFDVFRLTDVFVCEAHHRHRAGLQCDADRHDGRSLGRCLDHRRHIGIAERCRAGRHRLDRYAGAASFLDVEIDAFLVEIAAFLAEIEGRVLAIRVPVEQQDRLIFGLRDGGNREDVEHRGDDAECEAVQHCVPPVFSIRQWR